jgi:hypothetical protein
VGRLFGTELAASHIMNYDSSGNSHSGFRGQQMCGVLIWLYRKNTYYTDNLILNVEELIRYRYLFVHLPKKFYH